MWCVYRRNVAIDASQRSQAEFHGPHHQEFLTHHPFNEWQDAIVNALNAGKTDIPCTTVE